MEVEERLGMVENYLNILLPDNWDDLDIYSRRSFISNDDLMSKGTLKRTTVTNIEIWCECFNKNISEIKPHDSYAISALMLQIPKWQRTKKSKAIPNYGRQRLYEYKD